MALTILVPIDGSPLADRALRHSLETYPEAKIIAYYVSSPFDPHEGGGEESAYEPIVGSDEWYADEQEAADRVFEVAEEIAAEYDRQITTEYEIGDPQRLIPEYATQEDVDHVVMGAHGRQDADRQLVGRVAETVVFRSPVSVTVIRE